MNRRHSHAGFTLVELLVAVGITVLMLALVGRIFFDTSQAVSMGIGTGQIIDNSRMISDQLERDTETGVLLGPLATPSFATPPGVLVIINKLYVGVPVTLPDGSAGTQNIRSDQLAFIRKADRLRPLAPQNVDTFSNNRRGDYARVWYGHLRRVEPSGSASGDLGRQALLLNVNVTTPFGGTEYYADGFGPGANVNSSGGQLSQGYSDVSNQLLYDSGTAPGPGLSTTAIMGPNAFYPIDSTVASPTTAAFVQSAAFLAFPFDRLNVNVLPDNGTFTSLQVAQSHPYFMGNVSDFIVEYAASMTGGATPDTDAAGDIKWYGYWFNDPNPGPNGRQRDPANPTGAPLNYDPTLPDVYEPTIATFPEYQATGLPGGWTNVDAVTAWRPNDTTTSKWPFLIRIRYRMHDSRGRIASTQNGVAQAGRWFEQIIKVERP